MATALLNATKPTPTKCKPIQQCSCFAPDSAPASASVHISAALPKGPAVASVTPCHPATLLNVGAYLTSASLLNVHSACAHFASASAPASASVHISAALPMPRQPLPLLLPLSLNR